MIKNLSKTLIQRDLKADYLIDRLSDIVSIEIATDKQTATVKLTNGEVLEGTLKFKIEDDADDSYSYIEWL